MSRAKGGGVTPGGKPVSYQAATATSEARRRPDPRAAPKTRGGTLSLPADPWSRASSMFQSQADGAGGVLPLAGRDLLYRL